MLPHIWMLIVRVLRTRWIEEHGFHQHILSKQLHLQYLQCPVLCLFQQRVSVLRSDFQLHAGLWKQWMEWNGGCVHIAARHVSACDSGAFLSASASCSIARSLLVYLPVWSSFSVPTCVVVLLLLPLRARRSDESLQRKSLLNLLCAICLSVSLFVCCMPACLSACCLLVRLLFLTACLSATFLFCLLVHVSVSLRPVLLITHLLVC